MKQRLTSWVLMALMLVTLGVHPTGQLFAQSQYGTLTNTVFPAFVATATAQTSPVIQFGTVNGQAGSFSVGTISVAGTGLTTVTWSLQGSSDGGNTFYALNLNPINSPSTTATTETTTSNGLYQVNLSGLTQVRFVTSGTFTATSVSFVLTASPAGVIARLGSGGGSSPFQSLTTTGSSGAATLNSGVLNIPVYSGGSLPGGATGSAPYQSAASTTSFIASPTTTNHTFFYGWQPSGSAIAPVALDLSSLSTTAAASTSAIQLTTAPFTGGTGTTTFPMLYFNSGVTQPTTFSTNGSFIGVNAPSGFSGEFLDFRVNGGSSLFFVSSAGNATMTNANINGTATLSGNGGSTGGTFSMSGAPYTGGTGTTNYPLAYWGTSGATAVSTWGSGTYLGINSASGFVGNFFDFHVNGGGTVASLSYQGVLSLANSISAAGASSLHTTSASTVPLTVNNGNASPTADLTDWQVNSTTVVKVQSNGTMVAPQYNLQTLTAGPNLNYFEDYIGSPTLSNSAIGTPSGNSCVISNTAGDVNHPGTVSLITGTGGSGTGLSCGPSYGFHNPLASLNTSPGWTMESNVYVTVLPGTTAGTYQVGSAGTLTASPWTTGIAFELSSANSVPNDWYCEYGSTLVDTGIAATVGWTRLDIISTGTTVSWYIGGTATSVGCTGVAVGSLPSNVQSQSYSAVAGSSTSVSMNVDYTEFQRVLTR